MAIINAGILGGIRKAVGNVVGARYKGIDYIRLRVTPTLSQSENSKKARDNMRAVMKLARFNNESLLKDTFGKATKGTKLSPINRFVSKALKGIDPFTQYDQIQWSEGVRAPIIISGATFTSNYDKFRCDVDLNSSGFGSDADIVVVFLSKLSDPVVDILVSKADNISRTSFKNTAEGTGYIQSISSGKWKTSGYNDVYAHAVVFSENGEVSSTSTCAVEFIASL